MTQIYFRVNNKIIYNHLLARYESFVSGQNIDFVCNDQQYNQLNWLQEPAQTIDQLMDQHAINLRNQYQRLVLLWSGGTDSHTIYNVFRRCNLHIDEIVVFVGDQYEPWNSMQYVDWLRTHHDDPHTKITVKNRFDPAIKQQIVNNEDWLFQNTTMIPKMVVGTADRAMHDYCEQSYGGQRWCLIIGLEQPQVRYYHGQYWAYQNSEYLLAAVGFANIECFYLEPQLAVKQAHMIKRMLKLKSNLLDHDNYMYQRRGSANAYYTAWQTGLGRHQEVIPGMSHAHKMVESSFDLEPVQLSTIDGNLSRGYDRALDALLLKQDDMANVFVQGIKNLLLEKKFCEHLIETSTTPNKSLIAKSIGQPIYSKRYCIGN